jgi:hypothetical protein
MSTFGFGGGRRANPRRVQPAVEALEDRCVPATFATPNQNFVAALYRPLFGRDATANDTPVVQNLGNLLDRGAINRIVAAAFLEGQLEHRVHEAAELFEEVLERPVRTQADLNVVLGLANLRVSGASLEQVKALLFSVDEVFNRDGGRNDNLVRDLFRDILRRDPNSAELANITQFLNAGGSRFTVAMALQGTSEGREVEVEELFEDFLERGPDRGRNMDRAVEDNLVAALLQGVPRDVVEAVFAGIDPEVETHNEDR